MEEVLNKERITDILKSIGLNKNEIEIYLDLIKSGLSSVIDISNRTKIHRSNAYDSLRTLVNKGFIREVAEDNRRSFQAIDPEKIKDYLKQKEQEFDLILPNLKKYSEVGEVKGNISMSQGAFAAREELLDLLTLDSPILVYGASKEAVDTFGHGFLGEFHRQRIKKNIVMLHIYNKSAIDRINSLNKMKYTEARFLSKRYDTVAATIICKDRVLMIVFNKPIIVLCIKNAEVAESYRNYFELLWKYSKR